MMIRLDYRTLFQYLINTGIWEKKDLKNIKFDAKCSKPFKWVFDRSDNKKRFVVKQAPQLSSLLNENLVRNEWCIYSYLQSNQNLTYLLSLIPEVLNFDRENLIIVYQTPSNYLTLENHYQNQAMFSNLIAEVLGISLAKMHRYTMVFKEQFRNFIAKSNNNGLHYQLSHPDYLSDCIVSRIYPESLKKTPTESWAFFAKFQHSGNINTVVKELILNHRHCCLTHNNIQFNSILIPIEWEKLFSSNSDFERSPIKLIDWEACSWGDPAYDLGKTITGYFLLWIDSMLVHPAIEIKKSIRSATISLETILASISAMTKAYIKTYPEILEFYPEFIERSIQFAGLGLIYQILAGFQPHQESCFSRQTVYYYIATQLLSRPEKFMKI